MPRRLRYLALAGLSIALLLPSPATEAKKGGGPGPTASASIVGGRPADPTAWAFTAAVLKDGRLICSGSVIAPTRVLTAGHCATDPAGLQVVIGKTRLGSPTGGELIAVTAAAVHPDFASTRLHDLGVLTLASPTTATPVRLASAAEAATYLFPGQRLQIAGFGFQNPLRFGRPRIGVLRAANVRVGPPRFCRSIFRRRFTGGPMICTIGRQIARTIIGRGACYGDSGGPLAGVSPDDGLPRVFGVASFVPGGRGPLRLVGCALLGTSVYASVADGVEFINANLPPPTP